MTTNNEMYYNRVMDKELESIIVKKYSWLIQCVKKNPELDFQTGSNKGNTWFSIYRGTGRIATINKRGKVSAAKKYKDLCPDFYSNPTQDSFLRLLNAVKEDKSFDRYYSSKTEKKEGYYQNLISKRYSLNCHSNDDFIIIDKEFVIGYKDQATKDALMAPFIKGFDNLIGQIKKKYPSERWPSEIKQSGEECDFLALTKDGDILLLELKRHGDTEKIYLSPLQAGKYEAMTKAFVDKYADIFFKVLCKMVDQKKRMEILFPAWDMPKKLSGNVFSAVIVGGNASSTAIKKFKLVREIVGKNIPYYTCDEDGTLIKVEL